jgi:hypothetical protein
VRLLLDPATLRYWLGVVLLATALALLVGRSVSAADDARARWGRTQEVLVSSRAIEPDEDLAGAVQAQRWPVALVPDGALTDLEPSARASGALLPGTPLTEAMVAERTADPDQRTVALAADSIALPIERGRRIELWSADPLDAGGRAARVAEATVVGPRDDAVLVAVDRSDLAAVVAAQAAGSLVVVGTG